MYRLRWTCLYVILIPLVNWSFAHVPTIALPDGGNWAPMALVTGLVLVFRDFAQREVGHYIFIPLILGVAISYAMAPPEIALASGLAFAVSELVDWAVFTFTRRPLSQRVILSSALAAPLDSTVFLGLASLAVPGIFTPLTVLSSVASKLLGAYIVYRILRRREGARI